VCVRPGSSGIQHTLEGTGGNPGGDEGGGEGEISGNGRRAKGEYSAFCVTCVCCSAAISPSPRGGTSNPVRNLGSHVRYVRAVRIHKRTLLRIALRGIHPTRGLRFTIKGPHALAHPL
jgi:hypothetical protein